MFGRVVRWIAVVAQANVTAPPLCIGWAFILSLVVSLVIFSLLLLVVVGRTFGRRSHDSKMLGVLYMGSMDFAVDPFTGFRANLSTLRAEIKALYHVRNIQGARRIAAT